VPFRRINDPERLQALIGAMLLISEDLDLSRVLRTIVQTGVDLTGARFGALGVLDETGTHLAEFIHVGMDDATVAAIGGLPEGRGILGTLIKEPRPLRLAQLADHPESAGVPGDHPHMERFLGVPVTVHGEPFGNLYLTDKADGSEFAQEDEDVCAALALAAGLAIDKARAHAQLRDLTLSEERERIAHDLHDTTIKRLFAIGLNLQSTQRILGQSEAPARLQQAIDDLDDTIREIRTTIFASRRPRRDAQGRTGQGTTRELLRLVEDVTVGSGFTVHVELDGAIDGAVGRHAAGHLFLALRQLLTGVMRRPGVSEVEVTASLDSEALTLEVADDGAPFDNEDRQIHRSLAEGARSLRGGCEVSARSDGRNAVLWRVERLQ